MLPQLLALAEVVQLAVATQAAQELQLAPPAVASGGGACEDDWGCALGGLCTAGQCVCDHWTTGPQCNLLNLAHLERDISSYGLQMPGYHSCERPAAAICNALPAGLFQLQLVTVH